MTQKVLKIGTSAAVILPKRSLGDLGIAIGDRVSVEVDKTRRVVKVMPVKPLSKEEEKITKLTLNFINKYRKDLEALARLWNTLQKNNFSSSIQ